LIQKSVRRWKAAKSDRVKADRMLLHDWLLIMANSGMRPTEAKNLRWKDVEYITDAEGSLIVSLWVRGKGKRRQLIAQPRTRLYLNRLRERTSFSNDEDPVFCNDEGIPIESFKKGFDALLKDAGLLHDRYSEKRAPYSLRHTYATFALIYGRVSVYTLAVNMGTSVAMIEKHYGHVKPLQAHRELTARYKI